MPAESSWTMKISPRLTDGQKDSIHQHLEIGLEFAFEQAKKRHPHFTDDQIRDIVTTCHIALTHTLTPELMLGDTDALYREAYSQRDSENVPSMPNGYLNPEQRERAKDRTRQRKKRDGIE